MAKLYMYGSAAQPSRSPLASAINDAPEASGTKPNLLHVLEQEVLDLVAVAKLLKVHPKTVRQLAQAGKIPAFRLGKLWRFSRSGVHEWVASHGYNRCTVCAA
jgi:excisionase family DNA binding protein